MLSARDFRRLLYFVAPCILTNGSHMFVRFMDFTKAF